MPPWLGDEELHRTHRSALLHKLPEYYKKYGWDTEISDPKVAYLWPRPIEGKYREYELSPPNYWKHKSRKGGASPPQKMKKTHRAHSGHMGKGISTRSSKRNQIKKKIKKTTKRARIQRQSCKHLRRSPRLANM